MKTITITEAIELIKSTNTDLRAITNIKEVIGLNISELEVVSQGNHYKFYKYNNDYLILEEFPQNDVNHYFYLCESSDFDTIGEIGFTSKSPEILFVD